MTASYSCAALRACIHRSAFYHDFTGSFLAISTSCSDSGHHYYYFLQFTVPPLIRISSTLFPAEAPIAAPKEAEVTITVPPLI